MQLFKNNVFVKAAVVVLVVFCLVMIVSMQIEYNELRARRDVLLAELDAINVRIQTVQSALNAPFDEEYIIKIAREKLNLRLPEEVVFYNDLID